MQLSDLKPAWQQLKVMQSMDSVSAHEILSIIAEKEQFEVSKLQRILISTASFLFLIICCHGG